MKETNRNEELELLLARAPAVRSPGDLAERIIAASQQTAPADRSLFEWLGQLFAEVMLPKPAYVLTSALILGVVTGAVLPAESFRPSPEEESLVLTALFYDDDSGL